MASPPTNKRIKTTVAPTHPLGQQAPPYGGPGPFDPAQMVPAPQAPVSAPLAAPVPAPTQVQPHPQAQPTPQNPRKRRASSQFPPYGYCHGLLLQLTGAAEGEGNPGGAAATPEIGGKKKGRTNTPWTAEEEQRLKTMRDAGNTWSEIAKTFPTRTEGSVKKHWYKDMHYAEFAEEETIALRDAIKEYESNKWKVIGHKIGKPAKACEHYAKEHFKNL
ncbi:hypothetical protein AJ80_08012 [Polytolypa hystricis UAMH7299]|uniref:MYB DNA-binding domain protein n=1 Tax=Polytolypa hystricis (strain UAMH7299) TaxID=1447883 RepID=A0A2B7XF42_POLH7|nr:hypothetical protein AJ80_08012 [Polytolypa hystricis UAMH7299]